MPPFSYPDSPTPDQLIEAIKPLPPTARVLSRLQQLLSDPNSGLDDISTLLRLDAPLVTRVIHVSNSIVFRRGEATRTIEEAVNRIGFREIYRLVAVIAAQAISSGPMPAYGMSGEQVWEESVACALAAEHVANHLNEDGSVAYTVGLLRAIGRRPINQYLITKDAAKVLNNDGYPNETVGAEIAVLGYSHAEVAAALLKKWDFPAGTVFPVRHQFAPLSAGPDHETMASILMAARLLAAKLITREEPPVADDEADVLGVLRINRGDLTDMLPRLSVSMERARQITGALKSVR